MVNTFTDGYLCDTLKWLFTLFTRYRYSTITINKIQALYGFLLAYLIALTQGVNHYQLITHTYCYKFNFIFIALLTHLAKCVTY